MKTQFNHGHVGWDANKGWYEQEASPSMKFLVLCALALVAIGAAMLG